MTFRVPSVPLLTLTVFPLLFGCSNGSVDIPAEPVTSGDFENGTGAPSDPSDPGNNENSNPPTGNDNANRPPEDGGDNQNQNDTGNTNDTGSGNNNNDTPDSGDGETVALFYDASSEESAFATADLQSALETRGYSVARKMFSELEGATQSLRIIVAVKGSPVLGSLESAPDPTAEGYAILHESEGAVRTFYVSGGDDVGAMYGGLRLAEHLLFTGSFSPFEESKAPHFEKRGQKMNIPLDARATSYADAGDAPWAATQDVWDVTFWEAHFDEMARHRYNLMTLWAPNPFVSMVDVSGFNVDLDDQPQRWDWDCLQDWRSRDKEGSEVGEYDTAGDEYSGRGLNGYEGPKEHGCTTEDVPTNGRGIAGISGEIDSIEGKVRFWNHVIDYAGQRGIDVYFITWNVISHVAADRDEDIIRNGEDQPVNDHTEEYFRESVKSFVSTFPGLDGLGWYAGEGMEKLRDRPATEYCARVYAQGVHEALASEPNREFKIVPRTKTRTHRDSDIKDWVASAIDTFDYPHLDETGRPNVTFDFSFKYNTGRLYGDTTPGKHTAAYDEGDDSWTLWNIRNDDIFNVRIAAPFHVREMFCNMPRSGIASDANTDCDPPSGKNHPNTRGYHLGADGFVWTRDYESGPTRGMLQMEKHWAHFALWGRVGYDPDFDGMGYMVDRMIYRYGLDRSTASRIVEIWNSASEIFIRANDAFEKSDKDYGWYPEFPGVARTINARWSWIDGDSFNDNDTEVREGLRRDLDALDDAIDEQLQGTYQGELAELVKDIHALRWIGWIMVHRAEAASKSSGAAMADELKAARNAWYEYAMNIGDRYGRRQMPARVSLFDVWNIYHQEMCEDIQEFGDSSFDCAGQHADAPGVANLCDLH